MSLIQVKKAFFNQQKLIKESNRITLRALSKLGAFSRRTIQFSMKSKKGASPAGSPPHAHGQKLLKRHTYFFLDKQTKRLIVGPIRLSKTASQHVPKLHEHSGVKQVRTKSGIRIARYPQRAYVAPGVKENLVKLKSMFK